MTSTSDNVTVAARSYPARLCQELGHGWNCFWYTPSPANTLGLLRVAAGSLLTYWLVTFCFDLQYWFGPQGLLPVDIVRRLNPGMIRWSFLEFASTSMELWLLHGLCLAVAVLFTLGFWTRPMSVLALLVGLSYSFRAPVLTGQFEPVLTMLLAYLVIGRCGDCYSLDRWRRGRAQGSIGESAGPAGGPPPSWTNTVSRRLIQLHTAGFCLMMALTQLGGAPWWDGSALWWLIADDQARLVDWTFLRGYPDVLEAGTHAIVFVELCGGLLIWHPLARPILLPLLWIVWLGLMVLTGNVLFFLALIVASWSFIQPEWAASFWGRNASTTKSGASLA
jgi:hypothetical protein